MTTHKTLRDHINDLIDKGLSPRQIAERSDNDESAISRLRSGGRSDLFYMSGKRIEELNRRTPWRNKT